MDRKPSPKRSGLFGGLLFLYIGTVFLCAQMGFLSNAWTFFGRYWPLLLILAGLAKTVEYLIDGNSKIFRWSEVFLVLLLIIFGLIIQKSAPFLDSLPRIIDWDKGKLSLQSLIKEPYRFQEDMPLDIKAGGVLKVTNKRGNINILPIADGQTKIRIYRQVYSETEEEAKKVAEKMQPQISQEGNQTRITVDLIRDTRSHLEILTPSPCTLHLESNDGDISAEGITGTDHSIRALHGDLFLSTLSGGVTATSENGKIQVENLTGPVSLTGSHGSIEARAIHGNLSIANSNASIRVADVKGDVLITNNHGSVSVLKTAGKVDITAPQSKVVIEDVQGPVRTEASQREVRITRVATSAVLKQKHGSLHVERIGADLQVSLEYTEFHGYDLQGVVHLDAEYSEIRLEKTTGKVHVRNRLKPVSIIDFSSPVQVENENASVYLSTSEPVQQTVQVRTDHGKIEFLQPENSRFRLNANTHSGRIVSDFPQLLPSNLDHRNVKTINGELGSGGPLITLESSKGSIWIRKIL